MSISVQDMAMRMWTGKLVQNGDNHIPYTPKIRPNAISLRYFGTEHGSELALLPGAIHLTGGSRESLKLSFRHLVRL
ncbi:hypothetical protein [Paenibacillus ferrarius]|nr:hypothetical protein [Paenibacillus ferrarius]